MRKIILFLILYLMSLFGFAQDKPEEVIIDKALYGDLYKAATKNTTLAIIVAGSGPTDRNGNQAPVVSANAYKLLAEGLQANGINVFTFDKRILYQMKRQEVKEEEQRFDDLVDDVSLIIDHFKKDYPSILLIGHSEGGLVSTLVAQKNTAVKQLVLLAAPGEPIDQILYKQLGKQAPFLLDDIQKIHNSLKAGEKVTEVNPMLFALYRPSVQNYLISWMKYDPVAELKKVKQPILIIQGSRDLQVEADQGDLLKKGMPTATLVTLDKMNHILKIVEQEELNLQTYSQPDLPLQKDLIPTLTTFIKNN